MAYYLENTNAATASRVSITSQTIGATIGDYLEIKFRAYAGNSGDLWRLVGQNAGFNNKLYLSPTAFQAEFENTVALTKGITAAVGVDYVARIERVATGVWEYFLDGVSLGTANKTANFVFDQFMGLSSSAGDQFLGRLYYVEVSTDGGTAITNYWDPTAANGTGSILPDTSGTNDGTLVNFPTDNSQWVEIIVPASLTVTQTTLTPGGTISGTTADYATAPTVLTVSDGANTISSAGASPKITGLTITPGATGVYDWSATIAALPTTGTADMILFTDTATVELS